MICKAGSWLWSWTLRISLKKRRTEGGTRSHWSQTHEEVNAHSSINTELSFKCIYCVCNCMVCVLWWTGHLAKVCFCLSPSGCWDTGTQWTLWSAATAVSWREGSGSILVEPLDAEFACSHGACVGFLTLFPKGEKLMEFYINLLQTAPSSPPRSMSSLPPSSILLHRELLKLCRSGTERWESPWKGRQMWEKITGLHRIAGERVWS